MVASSVQKGSYMQIVEALLLCNHSTIVIVTLCVAVLLDNCSHYLPFPTSMVIIGFSAYNYLLFAVGDIILILHILE